MENLSQEIICVLKSNTTEIGTHGDEGIHLFDYDNVVSKFEAIVKKYTQRAFKSGRTSVNTSYEEWEKTFL